MLTWIKGRDPRGVPGATVWCGCVHYWERPLQPGLGARVDQGLPLRATSACCSTALGGRGANVGTARMRGSGAQEKVSSYGVVMVMV